MITKADIEKLAKLSRLKLTEDEKEKYAKDMENILAYVKQIDAVTPASAEEISLASSMRATAGASLKSSYAEPLSPSHSENTNKLGRNDKITIEKNGEKKEIKFKKLDEYKNDGWKVIS